MVYHKATMLMVKSGRKKGTNHNCLCRAFYDAGCSNMVYLHLDGAIVKNYTYEELENTAYLLR